MSNNRIVNVTVHGEAASGKSTIAYIIQNALVNAGINVEMSIEETTELTPKIKANISKRIESMKHKNVMVKLETKQLRKSHKPISFEL